jgi:predicted membrane-bound spermidine synthase
VPVLFAIFFISGFTALQYQVVWQRMLGLFSGSDVRSVTIIVAAYLAGLGLGSLVGGFLSDLLSNRQCVYIYSWCNLGIAIFALSSRWLFYDFLFLQLRHLARSPAVTLPIAFLSLLIPTLLMGVSLPLLAKAIGRSAAAAAPRIGWLYGVNTLGSGLGSLVSGWYLVGTLGYVGTVYLGAALNALVAAIAVACAHQLEGGSPVLSSKDDGAAESPATAGSVAEWCCLVFLSGFIAISLEILWFRVLDVALQSNAYTYAHLLAFILASNALGSLVGAKCLRFVRNPRRVFLAIQGCVTAYAAIAIWLIGLYWQSRPDLRADIGYIDPNHLTGGVAFKYLALPLAAIVLPNFLLGVNFPLVQQAIQTDDRRIGRRVGLVLVTNILGNTAGSLVTGLVLLDRLGTAASLRLLLLMGLGFAIALQPYWRKAKAISGLVGILLATLAFFPSNPRLWASLHGISSQDYFIAAEDSTGVATIAEVDGRGALYASGQIQANFPYLHVHALLGTIPALLHPKPTDITIIGLGSGGTPHTFGVHPLTQHIRVVEILGAELPVLQAYAKTPVGQPLNALFQDPRYDIVVGDGRQELAIADRQFDIIEADAIQPWRSRAGMLYSKEFFQEVRSHLAPGGFFAEWNVGYGAEQTFRHVFPYVTTVQLTWDLGVLIGGEQPIEFDKATLLSQLQSPAVLEFLDRAGVDVVAIRRDVKAAKVRMYSHANDGQPPAINTDLFPSSEYYLNRPLWPHS